MKKLEEMNLVDDFLAYSVTAHKIYGEKASRCILECILQRRIRHLTIVPQKVWYGEEPESHGVRLDVYLDEEDGELFDLEPDNNSGAGDVAALPRRVRFYHAKIDAGNLATGEDYNSLRNVVVIFITTYDPFGRKRMVYTIKNGCVEEPDMPYEDGATTIFLYTKGTEGKPSEELRLLLRYMENSTTENARSEKLIELHEMVMKVKSDRKVGLEYMKWYEIQRRERIEGKVEDIMDLLEDIGTISEQLEKRVRGQRNLETLRIWHKLAAHSTDIMEFERLISEPADETEVKSDKKVWPEYMKRYEILQRERVEGRLEGKAEDIMELLEDIGAISEQLEKQIREQNDLETLGKWLKLAARSKDIMEFERLISEPSDEAEVKSL